MPDSVLARSPQLIDRSRSMLLIVDLQSKLLPAIRQGTRVVWNSSRLLRGANVLKVPTVTTEQYPEKLGQTVAAIADLRAASADSDATLPAAVAEPLGKRMFSCRECAAAIERELVDGQPSRNLNQLVVCGIETHVCVLQTVMDFLQRWQVFVVDDACGARGSLDHERALARMQQAGATITSTESVLFEWCETSLAAEFKQISQLVRETEPPSA